MLPDLSVLLKYEHPKVLEAYVRNRGVKIDQARDLFKNMLLYLWLSRKHEHDRTASSASPALDFVFVMHQEMREIDEMWHNFILYTHDYTIFCQKFFGRYMHHVPDIGETVLQTKTEFARETEKYLRYVYDNLGEMVVRRWFSPLVGTISEVGRSP